MALKINRSLQIIIKIIGWVLLIALIACMVKVLLWERDYYHNKSVEVRSKSDVVITALGVAEDPSEADITEQDVEAFRVDSTKPRHLTIERLGIHVRIKESVVNSEVLPVPANIHDSMWYAGSGRPGEGGVILISGISKGATKPGAFANLDSLEKDDKIKIKNGQGDEYTYTIREILIIDSAEAEQKLPSIQRRIDDKETVSLVTAIEKTDGTDVYNSIVIVRATKD